MLRKTSTLIIILVILVLVAFGLFWFFFIHTGTSNSGTSGNSPTTGFSPFGSTGTSQKGTGTKTPTNNPNTTYPTEVTIPALRELSTTPIGGYGATTTASTTIVHWIDRGRGDVLEAREDSLVINTLSNTLLPKTYTSVWSADTYSFVGSILGDDNGTISTIFGALLPQSTSTSATPYRLQGKNLPSTIVSYAVSPDKKQIFLFAVQNNLGIGYIAPFNGGTATQIFSTPITQVNVDWPEANTISLTTKGSAHSNGYLYFVNPKTGVWKNILGPLPGLSALVSHDAKYALISATGQGDSVATFIYSIASSTANDAVIQTLADKCVWGNFYKDVVYCAVPFQPVSGVYPDDWYIGTLSTIDKLWQVNAVTGEVHLISSIFSVAKQSIDAFNLGLDAHDNYLFFMNKNDLSFWSLDLVSSK